MRPIHRWTAVAVGCALAVGVPIAVRARPVPDRDISAERLLALVRASGDTSYSGNVEVRGRLGLPIADHFTDLADLFGSTTRLRVWWRSADDWRVDRLLDTGEVDLFHHGDTTTEWDYERAAARTGVDPTIRLPRDSDLLPPELARRALTGVDPADVRRLPARRIAGVAAPGLRIVPSDPLTSIDHVDLWAEPTDGVVLALDAYGDGSQPVLTTSFTQVSTRPPPASVTAFDNAPGIRRELEQVLDIADAANQYAPVVPPASVAGLTESPSSREAVGIYGTGLTQLMALPLQHHDADELARQLETSGAQVVDGRPLLRVGPLGVVLTTSQHPFQFEWLVTGTVTDETLLRAADDLVRGTRFR